LKFDASCIALRIAAIRATTWVLVGDPIVRVERRSGRNGAKILLQHQEKNKNTA